MTVAIVYSRALAGVHASLVTVEAHLAQSEVLAAGHVAEAVGYRRGMDRM